MSSGSEYRNVEKATERANGTANGTIKSTMTETKETLQSPALPKASALWTVIRTTLLLLYFSTFVYTLAITQYIGAPLYLIRKDYYYRYMTFTKRGMALLILSMTQYWTRTSVHISGDESVAGQIRQLPDGRVECDFSDRLVLIANHQMYNDWVYLWHIAYTAAHHGSIYIVLKESIKYIPLIGFGLRMAGFVFMSRKMKTDQPRLTHRLAQLTRKDSSGQRAPMWLLMFPEGTNLSRNGRAASAKWAKKQDIPDLKYQLLPRSAGTYFCLKGLNGTVDWVYDCTLAYDNVPSGQYGQDIFTLRSTYVEGHPPPIHLHYRRFPLRTIPLSTLPAFSAWLDARFAEKELLLAHHAEYGRFPSSLARNAAYAAGDGGDGDEKEGKGKGKGGGGIIKTTVRLGHWTELLQFATVLVAQVCCVLGLVVWGWGWGWNRGGNVVGLN